MLELFLYFDFCLQFACARKSLKFNVNSWENVSKKWCTIAQHPMYGVEIIDHLLQYPYITSKRYDWTAKQVYSLWTISRPTHNIWSWNMKWNFSVLGKNILIAWMVFLPGFFSFFFWNAFQSFFIFWCLPTAQAKILCILR